MTQAATPTRAALALTGRLTRRSTLVITAAAAAFMAFEVSAFHASYPDEAALQRVLLWAQDPGIRIIAGPGTAVDTIGGFAVWDAGLYLVLGLGAWALTATTRVLRGDETSGRTDLLLAGALPPSRLLAAQATVLLANCLLVGIGLGLSLALLGAQPAGALLFGAMMTGYSASLVALAAVTSQVFAHRRAALSAAALAFAGVLVIRMLGNSADAREWLVWLSPAGWLDRSQAFGDNHWWVLALPTLFTIACLGLAALLRTMRDAGAGLLAERHAHRSMRWGLGGPVGFAWRSGLGTLAGWAAGLAVAASVIGVLLPSIEDVLASDTGFLQLLAAAGLNVADLGRSFVAMWGAIVGALLALFAAFRMGAAREEEASGRAELLLARALSRGRWLGAQVATLVAGVGALTVVSAGAISLAAWASGSQLTAVDAWTATANPLPAAAALAGFCVLVYGLLPRLTVPLGAAAVVTAYVAELVGPALSWPEWLLALSPFHHLAQAPVEPVAWGSAAVLVGIGIALMLAGLAAFHRRDLTGA